MGTEGADHLIINLHLTKKLKRPKTLSNIILVSFGHASPRSETLYPGLITLWRPENENIMS